MLAIPLLLIEDHYSSELISAFLGYKHVKGQRLTDLDLSELYEGLKLNEINEYTHILTGTTDLCIFGFRLVFRFVLFKTPSRVLGRACWRLRFTSRYWSSVYW